MGLYARPGRGKTVHGGGGPTAANRDADRAMGILPDAAPGSDFWRDPDSSPRAMERLVLLADLLRCLEWRLQHFVDDRGELLLQPHHGHPHLELRQVEPLGPGWDLALFGSAAGAVSLSVLRLPAEPGQRRRH